MLYKDYVKKKIQEALDKMNTKIESELKDIKQTLDHVVKRMDLNDIRWELNDKKWELNDQRLDRIENKLDAFEAKMTGYFKKSVAAVTSGATLAGFYYAVYLPHLQPYIQKLLEK